MGMSDKQSSPRFQSTGSESDIGTTGGSSSKAPKRHISDDNEDVPESKSKQPRTQVSSSVHASASKGVSSGSSLVASPSFSVAEKRESGDVALSTSQGFRSGLETTPGSGIHNPIDLTEMEFGGQDFFDKDRDLQVQHDEALARALQEEFDKGLDDTTTTSPTIATIPADEISPAGPLQAYGGQLQSTRCGKCKTPCSINGQGVLDHCKALVTKPVSELHPFVKCSKCRLHFCAGCGKYGRDLGELLHPKSGDGEPDPPSYCCDLGRIFLVFSLLCGPSGLSPPPKEDQASSSKAFTGIKNRLRSRLEPSTPEKKETKEARPPKPSKPAAYTSAFSKGTGYGGGNGWGDAMRRATGQNPKPKREPKADSSDEHLGWYFRSLSALLPDSHREKRTGFDMVQQPLILGMIMRSPLLPVALQLLHNNQMEEIAEKIGLYEALISFVTTLNSHGHMAASLFQEVRLWPATQQLLSITFARVTGAAAPVETTGSVASALEGLGKYCQFYVDKASSHMADFTGDEGKRVLELAQQICSLAGAQAAARQQAEHSRLAAAADHSRPASSVKTRAGRLKEAERDQERLAKASAEWHAENRVLEIPDEQFWDSYYYKEAAQELQASAVSRGRMKKLITQMASLRNDLPEGIFVRHASSRLDAIKVLFVGPSGTPYENGLFEFDFFCGAKFPDAPPQAQFRTTGGGRVGFNPNLYPDGKVCLSLLGTWNGQNWIPGESTLLQVMVSIQAMIFCDEPWYNEPGRDHRVDKTQSDGFNRTIQQATVRHAMLYWLSERLGQPEDSNKGKDSEGKELGKSARKASAGSPGSSPSTPGSHAVEKISKIPHGLINKPFPAISQSHLMGIHQPPPPMAPKPFPAISQSHLMGIHQPPPPMAPKMASSKPSYDPFKELSSAHAHPYMNAMVAKIKQKEAKAKAGQNNTGFTNTPHKQPAMQQSKKGPLYEEFPDFTMSKNSGATSGLGASSAASYDQLAQMDLAQSEKDLLDDLKEKRDMLEAKIASLEHEQLEQTDLIGGDSTGVTDTIYDQLLQEHKEAVDTLKQKTDEHKSTMSKMNQPGPQPSPFQMALLNFDMGNLYQNKPPAQSSSSHPKPVPFPATGANAVPLGQQLKTFGFSQSFINDLTGSKFGPPLLDVDPRIPDDLPIGNTVVDSNDDTIWGPVIRHHFAAKGKAILERVKQWEKDSRGFLMRNSVELTKPLEDAFRAHKFI